MATLIRASSPQQTGRAIIWTNITLVLVTSASIQPGLGVSTKVQVEEAPGRAHQGAEERTITNKKSQMSRTTKKQF